MPLVPCLPPAPQGFRFWLDEVLWSQGRVAVEVIEEVLQDAGGIRTGGPPRSAVQGPIDRVLGSEHADRWELLWSKSTYALRAARSLRPGKGLQLLTLRKALQTAEHFWEQGTSKRKHQLQVAQLYLTRPLLLEGRKSHLRLWVVVTHHSPLEAFLHRKGLVLFSSELYDDRHPFAHHQSEDTLPSTLGLSRQDRRLGSSNTQRPQDIGSGAGSSSMHPMSSCGPGHDPSSHNGRTVGKIAAGHLTNLARNSSGLVWGLDRLEHALGGPAYSSLWTQLWECTAATLKATKGALREAHAWLRPSIPEYGFQLLGFDYMLDQELKPWLIEVNSAPSIMAEHDDPDTAAAIRDLKQAMLKDMMSLVGHRIWRQGTQDENAGQRGLQASGRKSKNEQHGGGPASMPGNDFVWLDTR
ncbi:tubulin-tyrosine ligase family-domain-containing protein [Dunaliella salina]|uniref:Tubulin--tyrosine ligase-like protein 5 n=1 Tax=Dunaliella salina TaxID=3046 RepID=A0ABQ7H4D8_DUNSA|nr:tubulin-tyrosine ligase family-domain-containing protein [Dunaliella salina]|eukprot:KAF5841722.1 tubulin-tyrosine ligase family-domain-containing protein [Dunaliella salina]